MRIDGSTVLKVLQYLIIGACVLWTIYSVSKLWFRRVMDSQWVVDWLAQFGYQKIFPAVKSQKDSGT